MGDRVSSLQVTFLGVTGPEGGVTRSSIGLCSAKVHPDFRMPTSNLCVPHPVREKKDNKHTFVQGGGVSSCPPMQGRVGWTFPEREPGLALAPGALITPHPSLLQRAAKTSSGQDYVYWVDHGEASETEPREQREVERGPASEKRQVVSRGVGRGPMSGLNMATLPSEKSWTQWLAQSGGGFYLLPSPHNSAQPI